jgi:hypothetical protein
MPDRERLYVNERPWLTALACAAGMAVAAVGIWLLDTLL